MKKANKIKKTMETARRKTAANSQILTWSYDWKN
jgi:hypothetical protein